MQRRATLALRRQTRAPRQLRRAAAPRLRPGPAIQARARRWKQPLRMGRPAADTLPAMGSGGASAKGWSVSLDSNNGSPAPICARQQAQLSRRELEVLRCIASGLTDRQIAGVLCIARSTASNHVAAVLRKLDAPCRARAVSVGYELGLLS